ESPGIKAGYLIAMRDPQIQLRPVGAAALAKGRPVGADQFIQSITEPSVCVQIPAHHRLDHPDAKRPPLRLLARTYAERRPDGLPGFRPRRRRVRREVTLAVEFSQPGHDRGIRHRADPAIRLELEIGDPGYRAPKTTPLVASAQRVPRAAGDEPQRAMRGEWDAPGREEFPWVCGQAEALKLDPDVDFAVTILGEQGIHPFTEPLTSFLPPG